MTSKKTNPPSPRADENHMKQRVRILKRDQVQICGKVCLGQHMASGHLAASKGEVKGSGAALSSQVTRAPQQARILESNDEYAIIEVTCSCGAKSHIQCNYASMTKG